MDNQDIIDTIVEETDLDEEEIKEEIEKKTEEFEGLVSEEGAVHLVAKDHGIQISKEADQDLKIDNIVPDMRKVNLKARVMNILDPNTFTRDDGDEGKVQNIVLGDDTGTIRLTLWDEQTKIAEEIDEDDPIEIAGAYSIEDDRENAELRLGDSAQVKMADEEDVPEVESSGSSGTTESEIRSVNDEGASYEIEGMVMAIYTSNPFYSVCPECGSTVRSEEDEDEYVCEDHGEVEPDKALAISGVLDDGTDNIRAVFFRDQARELLEVDEETEKEGDIDAIEEQADEAVGKELRIRGRTRYNDYFGRIEMVVNELEEIDPENQMEEILEIMQV